MNPYPSEILPSPGRTLITDNINDFYLIRHADTSDIAELWNDQLNQVNLEYFCHPTTRIDDLSTSLLGIFLEDHCGLSFSRESPYNFYCEPDEDISIPKFQVDYTYISDRGHYYIKIGDISDKLAKYINPCPKSGGTYSGKCCVIHTPMKWNYWHFSIRWDITLTSDTVSENLEFNDLTKGMKKQFGSIARSLVADNTSITRPSNLYNPLSTPQQVT